jgi:hypothetical protein
MSTSLRLCIAIILSGALSPFAAFADGTASTNITLSGEAKPVCHLPGPTSSTGTNTSIDGNKISISQLLDEDTAMVKTSEANITYGQAMCNYAAYLSVASANGGMIRTSGTDVAVSGSGTFLDIIDYTIAIDWGTIKIESFDTAQHRTDKKAVKQSGGANLADLLVKISTRQGNTPVLRGTYTDTITINIGASY